MYEYGKHLGLAFQVVDDILDFTQSSEALGKPQGQDLASGNLTAPVLFALQVRGACRQWPAWRAVGWRQGLLHVGGSVIVRRKYLRCCLPWFWWCMEFVFLLGCSRCLGKVQTGMRPTLAPNTT